MPITNPKRGRFNTDFFNPEQNNNSLNMRDRSKNNGKALPAPPSGNIRPVPTTVKPFQSGFLGDKDGKSKRPFIFMFGDSQYILKFNLEKFVWSKARVSHKNDNFHLLKYMSCCEVPNNKIYFVGRYLLIFGFVNFVKVGVIRRRMNLQASALKRI